MVAVKEDAVGKLSENVLQYFHSQGAQEILNLAQGENYVFIGVKDQNNFTEKKGPGVGIGMVLSMSETERKVRKQFAATEGGSRIEFESAGFNDGNWASVMVENEEILTREQASRGLNVAVLDGRTHKLIMRKTYDTWGNASDVKALVQDAKKIPKGSVFIAVVKDEASRLLNDEARNIFIKMGSEEIKNLDTR